MPMTVGHAVHRRASLTTIQNHLIALLPEKDRVQLLAACDSVQLVLEDVLSERGRPTSYIYFPTEGFISLVAQIAGKPGVEVGMVGREGMLGVQLALGVLTAPLHALVQGAGAAWRISAADFRSELANSTTMQRNLNRYVYVVMSQLATSAACQRFHLVGPRLARWLLMSQDRAHTDSFHVTHEFLAFMLGVRRVGITAAAGALQHSGLIEYHRGELKVLNRRGLEAAACSCYAADLKNYLEQFH